MYENNKKNKIKNNMNVRKNVKRYILCTCIKMKQEEKSCLSLYHLKYPYSK